MPTQTFDQKEALYRYRTEPEFSAVVLLMADMVAKSPNSRIREIKFHAAIDFFLVGMAMIANPDEIDLPNCSPFDFEILPDGKARFIRPIPDAIFEKYGEPSLYPDQFILLQPEGDIPPLPKHIGDGVIEGHEPWLALWEKAEVHLDAFLGRVPITPPE